jgi:nucleoside-diphosphate kinase
MSLERTLSIIKPDATSRNLMGKIIGRFEENGLKIVAGKLIHMDEAKAGGFYAEHKERPFFPNLVEYMISAPVFVQVLEGENAVLKNRELMGATDPLKAEEGTLRKMYGISIDKNSVHGSDSVENAKIEINFFFK